MDARQLAEMAASYFDAADDWEFIANFTKDIEESMVSRDENYRAGVKAFQTAMAGKV